MSKIGEVHGKADTVLDALSEYMADGLLVFPTHTWNQVNAKSPKFHVYETPSDVGVLSELFRQRPNVIRSLHPTHSVSALGKDALSFTSDNERFDTAIARESSYGKLLDRNGKILLIGVDLTVNTFIHGIEEWNNIPNRLREYPDDLRTVLSDNTEIPVPTKRHVSYDVSKNYWKVEQLLVEKGAIEYGKFGDAKVLVCDAVKITKYISEMLTIDPDIFGNSLPLFNDFIRAFNDLT